MYLSRNAIDTTLVDLARNAPGTRVVLTYNQPRETLDSFSEAVTSALMALVKGWGEPFVSFYASPEAYALLQRHGFEQITDFGPDEARDTYFGGRESLEIAGAQRIATGTLLTAV